LLEVLVRPAFAIVGAYLLGSIPTSFLAGRIARVDLRQHGSRNLGATNVWRVLGPRYAIPVGLIDVAKGIVAAVLLGPLGGTDPLMPLMAGAAAILGHVFPVFLGFKGGKGVATAAGVLLGVAPAAVGLTVFAWLICLLATGYVSVASMTAAVVFPVAAWLVQPDRPHVIVAGLAVGGFVFYTHRSNIRRLMDGTESRFGHRRKAA